MKLTASTIFEKVALASIVLSSLAICLCVAKYLRGDLPPRTRAVKFTKQQLDISKWNPAHLSRSYVLALQTSCHFCTDSSPQFNALVQATKGKQVQVLAVLPGDLAQSKSYVSSLGLDIPVYKASLDSLGVAGTPTVIETDGNGKVLQAWVGQVTDSRLREIENTL